MLAPGLVLACAAAVIGMAARPAPQADALFEFHSNPWLNPRRRRPTPNASLDGVAIDRSVKRHSNA